MGNFREWLSDNLRYILLGLFIILALIVILVSIRFISSRVNSNETIDQVNQENQDAQNNSEDSTNSDEQKNDSSMATPTPTEEPVVVNALEKNAYPEVNAIIQKYYTALGNKDIEGIQNIVDILDATEQAKISKDQYLESYSGIEIYTKKGAQDGSYVVFANYNYKFIGIDAQVPGLSQLYVATNEDGSLYISMEQDEATQAYITDAVQEQDAQELITEVDASYKQLLEENDELREFVNSLGIATSQAVEAENGSTIVVRNNCNLREQPNEESTILDQLEAGTQVTKSGSEGDWIQVEYNTMTGYIRSDLFQ